MAAGSDSIDVTALEHIARYLAANHPGSAAPRIVPLTPDASDRRYFRAIRSDDDPIVLALHAGPIDFASLPFANVAHLFDRLGVPIPAILGHDNAEGIVAQSDLGDVTLQAHVGAASAAEHEALYRRAVDIIEVLQRRGGELADQRYLPYGVAFDVEKLMWEMDYFVRHFLVAYRGAALTTAEASELKREWETLTEELASEPRVLCHRDYHSRNLMVRHGELYVIDFQDARMGPDTYDLVSLLRDAYVFLPERTVEALIAYFLALKKDAAVLPSEFRRRFDLMAVQRNLKALGTFGYQATRRQNPVYIQYMARTLHYVSANLQRYPRFDRLRTLLASHIEELR